MKSKQANIMLPNTVRNLDDLAELLDCTIDEKCLPTGRPLTPAQVDKLVKTCLQAMLNEIHKTRLLFLQKHNNIHDIRQYSIELLKRETKRSKKVINPKTITVPRSIEIFDKRRQFIEDLFQEVLGLYEKQFRKTWIEPGSVK